MSFDLFFCRENGERPSDEEIARACAKHPSFKQPEDAPRGFWIYENEATGVYFTLEREAWTTEDDEFPELALEPPFVDAEMHANINFVRPSFFGVEAMAVIAALCHDLDLLVLDSQMEDDEGRVVPERLSADELTRRWVTHNDLSTGAAKRSGIRVHQWSRAQSIEWHRHQTNHQSFEAWMLASDRDVFVPEMMLVVPVGEEAATVRSMAVWPESIPFVIPPCDLIAVLRKRKKIFGGVKEEWGIMPTSFVRKQIGSLLRPLKTEWGTFDHLPEDHAAATLPIVAKWNFDMPKESVQVITPDSFVDDLQ